jgi:aerobic carbon-monoxide dehydrogenase medium subunit
VLIDVNRVAELAFIRSDQSGVAIGALTRHATIERSDLVRRACPLASEATRLIGYPSIRARATCGGSMAHADPAGEYPSVAMALEASLTLRSPRGERRVLASRFFKGLLTTDLAEDELIVEVHLPEQAPGEGWAYEVFATRPGDYATVSRRSSNTALSSAAFALRA